MTLSNQKSITIKEALELKAGERVKIEGYVKHALKPKKLWKGIFQFIVLKDNTETIGCNVSCDSIDNGYELGENLCVVGERGEYPEKDRRTGQLTGNKVQNINGYVESNWLEADREVVVTEKEGKEEKEEKKQEKIIVSVPKYKQEDYWRDKFLLDVERQETYKANNDTIIRECAIKAVTDLVTGTSPIIMESKKDYFKFADEIVAYIKNDTEWKLPIEANMIISGLSPMKKAEIIDWINNVRMGTDIEDDDDFLIKLNVQKLSVQTIKELRETVDTMMKYFLVTPHKKGE